MTVTIAAGTFPSIRFKFSFPGAEKLDQKLGTTVGAASAFSMAVCEKARLGGSLRFRDTAVRCGTLGSEDLNYRD